jgi:hypothetical protein
VGKRRNENTRNPLGYPISVGYEFEVILFISAWYWDEFGDTQTLWICVWGRQNPSLPHPVAMLIITLREKI